MKQSHPGMVDSSPDTRLTHSSSLAADHLCVGSVQSGTHIQMQCAKHSIAHSNAHTLTDPEE